MKYADLVTDVPQSEPLDGRQVKNSAGGFVYGVDDWSRLDRFLILGSDSNTYYQKARALTRENAACVIRCWDADASRTLEHIVGISYGGRAPKNDPAIFALALGAAHKDVKVRQNALASLPLVCRTSTHLFQFVKATRALGRGWGRTMVRAVAEWYDSKPVEQVAFQAIKYREREGYTHKRLLQTSHPTRGNSPAKSPERDALYRWICEKDHERLPAVVEAHIEAMNPGTAPGRLIQLISDHRLPWEAIPTEAKKDPGVWEAMLPHMGLTALIRNLGTMSRVGTLAPLGVNVPFVVGRLGDQDALKRDRIHPFTVLQAQAVYGSGQAMRGDTSWPVVQPIVDALEDAFYKAFANVEPTGKRTLVALDVSGSMTSAMNDSPLTVREAAAAMAMVTMRTEPSYHVLGFTSNARTVRSRSYSYRENSGINPLPISAKDSLSDVVCKTSGLPFGGTDCALPMLYADKEGLNVDTFLIYTDNETWAGSVHPMKALRDYRQKTGLAAKLVVVGMTATEFSIADANDAGALDVVGFDSACPALIADFARG